MANTERNTLKIDIGKESLGKEYILELNVIISLYISQVTENAVM